MRGWGSGIEKPTGNIRHDLDDCGSVARHIPAIECTSPQTFNAPCHTSLNPLVCVITPKWNTQNGPPPSHSLSIHSCFPLSLLSFILSI
jgi:hypothetical protein